MTISTMKFNIIYINSNCKVIHNFCTRSLDSDTPYFYFPKLIGNQLCGFRDWNRQNEAGVRLLEFCKIDLVTLIEEKHQVPFCMANNRLMPNLTNVRILIIFYFNLNSNSILVWSTFLGWKYLVF